MVAVLTPGERECTSGNLLRVQCDADPDEWECTSGNLYCFQCDANLGGWEASMLGTLH
jgi:hypothetical protein